MTRLFKTPYIKALGNPLKMTIEPLQMPMSEQRLGPITVHAFDVIDGVIREVDASEFLDLSSKPGEVQKNAPVAVGSTVASATNQLYTFDFKLFH